MNCTLRYTISDIHAAFQTVTLSTSPASVTKVAKGCVPEKWTMVTALNGSFSKKRNCTSIVREDVTPEDVPFRRKTIV